MKKTTFTFFAILLFILPGFSQNVGIDFKENLTWDQVKAKAKLEKKYIFIDYHATWCGPCKAMDAQVYPDEQIGSLLNSKFISIKVQHDQTNKDNDQIKAWYNDAKAINKEYHIESLPTFLFLTSDGKLMHRDLGYKDTSGFRQMASMALTNPMAKLRKHLMAYKKGKRDSAFLHDLVLLASDEEDKFNASLAAADYIQQMKDPFAMHNLEFIQRFTEKSNDPGFGIFYKNMNKVNEVLGRNHAERLIRKVIEKEQIESYLKDKSVIPNWDSLATAIKRKYGSIGEEKVYGTRMVYHLDRKEWENFGKAYQLYYQTAIPHSEYHINNISWEVFQHVTDPQVLAVAVEATKYNLENYSNGNPSDMDTYANLLYKAGRKEQAIQIQKKAVQLSNYNKELTETLSKMQKDEPTWPVNNN